MEHQHLNPEQIALAAEYQQQGKYADLPDEIKTHLSECDDCANEVLMIGDLLQEEKNQIKKRNTIYISLFSAIASAILIFFTITFFIKQDPIVQPTIAKNDQMKIVEKIKEQDINTAKKDTSVEKKPNVEVKKANSIKTNKTLAYYKPNDELEQLTQRFRESNMRSTETKSFPNEINLETKRAISLQSSDELFLIEIYNNKGILIQELNSKNDSIYFPKLSKGLYYWKLINEDFDLIFVGRIKK
jgi:hypothetical protein